MRLSINGLLFYSPPVFPVWALIAIEWFKVFTSTKTYFSSIFNETKAARESLVWHKSTKYYKEFSPVRVQLYREKKANLSQQNILIRVSDVGAADKEELVLINFN